jgi:putative membrane protein
MKTNTLISVKNAMLVLLFAAVLPALAFAQTTPTADDTAVAVAAGQQLSQKLGAKQISCSQLTDADYEHLGEYFMSQMMGSSHEGMNASLESRFGAVGEEQMHITMGKRLSGCDTQAAYPAGFQGFMPMMGGGSNSSYGSSMMGGYGWGGSMMGYGGFGLLSHLFWWILGIAIVVFVIRWFSGGTSAFDTLKERYAKGEIDKEEFEAKKKDILS